MSEHNQDPHALRDRAVAALHAEMTAARTLEAASLRTRRLSRACAACSAAFVATTLGNLVVSWWIPTTIQVVLLVPIATLLVRIARARVETSAAYDAWHAAIRENEVAGVEAEAGGVDMSRWAIPVPA